MNKTLKRILLAVSAVVGVALIATGITLYIIFLAPTPTAQKPDNFSTAEQPFKSGTAGVGNFRIPSLSVTADGRLIAACDARWDAVCDGGGLDTVVSVSEDGGKSWNGTFANYLGDNKNRYHKSSCAFIDPAVICADDGAVYLAVTLFPAEVSLNSTPKRPVKDSGFDENGRLLICKANSGKFDLVLGDFADDGFAPITDKSGKALENWKVDRYFNIYKKDKLKGNLFFKNSPFSVTETTYIYLNVSYDNGKSWDNPQLINAKGNDREFFGIAPGKGLQTADGTLVFPTYSLTDGDTNTQKSSFIYSKDKGKSWSVSPELTYDGWSGESQLVELDSNTLRCFFRNGNSAVSYCDVTLGENPSWSAPVVTDIKNCSNCMLSAIKYSKKLDGKDIILVSCPTAEDKREAGKIFVFALDGDFEMSLIDTVDITDGAFAYSCLAEAADGKIALLYEAENNSIIFKNDIEIKN